MKNDFTRMNRSRVTTQEDLEARVSNISRRGTVRRAIAFLSAVVVFFTMNTLKFDAVALQRIATCGMVEHLHDASCYDESEQLICGYEAHEHTDACYQEVPEEGGSVIDDFIALNAQVNLVSALDADDAPEEVVAGDVEQVDGETDVELDAAEDDQVIAKSAEDDADAPEEIEETFTYAIDGSSAFVGDVLRAAGISGEGITAVGEVIDNVIVNNANAVSFTVEPVEDVENEFQIIVRSDFEVAELGMQRENGELETVILTGGVALREQTAEAGEAPEEIQEPTEPEEETIVEEQPVEETVIEEESAEQTEIEENEEQEASAEDTDAEEAVKEEADAEETVEDAPTDEEEAEAAKEEPAEEENSDEEADEPAKEEPAEEENIKEETAEEETSDETADEPTKEEAIEEETNDEANNNEETAEEEAVKEEASEEETEKEETVEDAPDAEAAADEAVAEDTGDETDEAAIIDEETVEEPAEAVPAALVTTLDFTNYVATDDHQVFLYDAEKVAIFVSAEALEAVEGVAVQTVEQDQEYTSDDTVALEDGTLIITDNGTLATEDHAYVVTGLTMPKDRVEGKDITISTVDGDATLLNVEPVFKETQENYEDLFALFELAETNPSVLARLSDLFVAHAEEVRTLQMKLFEISLLDVDTGDEFEPGKEVHVEVTLPETIEGEGFRLYHIVDGNPELVKNAVVTDENGNATALNFSVDSLSPFALVYYTVDFEYTDPETGETIPWSWPGEGSYRISDIMAEIGVTGEISDVSLVRTIDVGGAQNVLYLSDDKTELISDAAFQDTFELTVVVDEKTYVLVVTDDEANVTYSTNLRDFLDADGVSITGATLEDGKYSIKEGQPYKITLAFKEKALIRQFDLGSENAPNNLTYRLPEGFEATGLTGEIEGTGFILDYTINGRDVTFSWRITDPDNFHSTFVANDTELDFTLEGIFKESKQNIDWSDSAKIDVEIDDDHNVNVKKTGRYDANTNKMWYTVTVTSDGVNKNIQVKDVINSTGALIYDEESLSFTADKSITAQKSGNGFEATIPLLYDGESVQFTYAADVDVTKLTVGENGKYGTPEQTGNSVTAKSTEDPTGHSDNFSLDHEIQFAYGEKNVTEGELVNGKRTLNWEITLNGNRTVALNGTFLTDHISADAKNLMKYSGAGIAITKYDKNGQVVGTEGDVVPWTSLEEYSESDHWKYKFTDEEPYYYVITYTTEVDVSGEIAKYPVTNDWSYEYGGGSKSVDVTPDPDKRVDLEKSVHDIDLINKKVEWYIDITVPPTGLTKAVVTETFPKAGGLANPDPVDALYGELSGIKIDDPAGLVTASDYTMAYKTNSVYQDGVNVDRNEGVTITFKYSETNDQGETVEVPGIKASGTQRVIRITLSTELNEIWLRESETWDKVFDHINNVSLDFGGGVITDTAKVTVNPHTAAMNKTATESNEWSNFTIVNENQTVPYWLYSIVLSDINESSFDKDGNLVITDNYDSEYLALLDADYVSQGAYDSNISTNNQDDNVRKGNGAAGNCKLTPDTNGSGSWNGNLAIDRIADGSEPGTITFTIPRSRIPMADVDGQQQFYKNYRINYYLYVKSKAALSALQEAAAYEDKGVKKLHNTATWGDITSQVDVEYTHEIVNKSVVDPGKKQDNGNYEVYYTVDINPNGFKLGDEDYISVTDTVDNMSVEYTSITWEPEDAVVNQTRDGNTITYIMKNETHVTLHYTCIVHSTGSYNNEVTVHGQKDSAGGTVTQNAWGSIQSGDYKISILKHDSENMLKKLSGVTFTLYRWSHVTGNSDDGWVELGDYVTDDDGIITLDEVPKAKGSSEMQDLIPDDVEYKLVEHKQSETVGFTDSEGTTYKPLTYEVKFTIGKEKQATYADPDWVYLNNDIIGVANEPVEEEKLDIKVKKLWGGSEDESELPTVTLHLYKKQTQFSKDKELVETFTLPIDQDGVKVWEKDFANLDKDYYYFIEEDSVTGYTSVYSANNILGLKHSGTLSVTNNPPTPEGDKINIGLTKKWKQGDNTTPPAGASATFTVHQLKSTRTGKQGAYTVELYDDSDLTTLLASCKANADETITFSGKINDATKVPGADIYVKNRFFQYDYSSEYKDFSIGSFYVPYNTVDFSMSYQVNVNDASYYHGIIKLYFSKRDVLEYCDEYPAWDEGEPSYSEYALTSFTKTVTLPTASGAWSTTIKNLVQEDEDGNFYKYYITEDSATPTAKTVTFKDNRGADIANAIGTSGQNVEVTNEYENPKGSVKVTKAFSGLNSLPSDFKITASWEEDSQSKTKVFTIGSDDMTGTGAEDNPYTWTISDLPLNTEVSFSESGYNVTGYNVKINGEATAEEVTATAAATPDEATFTNSYTPEKVDVDVTKTWGNGQQPPEGATIQVKLKAEADSTAIDDEALKTLTGLEKLVITMDGENEQGDDTEKAWYYKWQDLPKYNGDGKLITYSVEETEYKIGEDDHTSEIGENAVTADGYSITVTNDIPTTNIKAKKNWPADQTTLPTGTTVKLKIEATVDNGNGGTIIAPTGVTITPGEVTLDGVVDTGNPIYETMPWEYTWENLPEYDTNGKKIKYTVTETEYKIGEASYDAADADATPTPEYDFSFTNQLPTTTISGKKYWQTAKEHTDPILKLVRRYYDGTGNRTETVIATEPYGKVYAGAKENATESEYLQPDWKGEKEPRTYTFSDLPMYSPGGYKYTYEVSEASFRVKFNGSLVTYVVDEEGFVTKQPILDQDGKELETEEYVNLPEFFSISDVTANGKDFLNGEATTVVANKNWVINGTTNPDDRNIESITYKLIKQFVTYDEEKKGEATVCSTVTLARDGNGDIRVGGNGLVQDNWSYKWTKLQVDAIDPERSSAGAGGDNIGEGGYDGKYVYTVQESEFKYAGVTYEVNPDTKAVSVKGNPEGKKVHPYWKTSEESNEGVFTFTNDLKEKSFEVTKKWDVAGSTAWPEGVDSITLNMVRGTNSSNGTTITTEDDTFGLTLMVNKTGTITFTKVEKDGVTKPDSGARAVLIGTVTEVKDGDKVTGYKIHVDGLEDGYIYRVEESTIPGYVPSYYQSNGETWKQGEPDAYNGEVIMNTLVTYELPSTGGTGTTIFYAGGISLMLFAFLGFVLSARKRARDGI